MRLFVRSRLVAAAVIALAVAAVPVAQASASGDPGEQIKDGATQFGEGIKNGAIRFWDAVKSGANTVGDKLNGHPAPQHPRAAPEAPPTE